MSNTFVESSDAEWILRICCDKYVMLFWLNILAS